MNLTNRYPSLEGKVVLVTGGASGIGANLVEAFFSQGANVAFLDRKNDDGEALHARLTTRYGSHSKLAFFPCDLVDVAALQSTIQQVIAELGPVNVLLNNAAHDERHDFREVTVEYWDERVALNLRHYFFAAQAVYSGMREAGGGSIINFGSISWYARYGGMPGYTSSKAAVEGLTRGLARDMGHDGIRVNTLIPGWVMTQRQIETNLADQSTRESILAEQCLHEFVKPENVTAMALFLASDDSRMCTAQNFIVDGGMI
ncbi:SDR family NAD(P)-dependent oxidoreductase [Alteromonas aestuariivivens]|uniref:SDR family NAD(P)-dependent oxidoreductase n=2 Tax=Alteromonas aestuariivivens TaxID=1938339 RepID=A0A3D8MF11_9ALTE|nr:SDR family NAD(P)-dependent oxidoreductase [Alteromonas aestuariivivens]